jgi:hypothetical protein
MMLTRLVLTLDSSTMRIIDALERIRAHNHRVTYSVISDLTEALMGQN